MTVFATSLILDSHMQLIELSNESSCFRKPQSPFKSMSSSGNNSHSIFISFTATTLSTCIHTIVWDAIPHQYLKFNGNLVG